MVSLWFLFNMTNRRGEFSIAKTFGEEIILREDFPSTNYLPLTEPSFYKILFTTGSSGGDVNYDLRYCEDKGNACKFDKVNPLYLSIGVGASCLIILLISGVLSYFFCYRKRNQVARKQPENIELEEFSPNPYYESSEPATETQAQGNITS